MKHEECPKQKFEPEYLEDGEQRKRNPIEILSLLFTTKVFDVVAKKQIIFLDTSATPTLHLETRPRR